MLKMRVLEIELKLGILRLVFYVLDWGVLIYSLRRDVDCN